jgi:glycine cleavage system H lipoate-binding protein
MIRATEENRRCKEEGRPLIGKRGSIISWKDKMKMLPSWKRPCIHHMKGRIAFRPCDREYRCGDCEFDQYFQDQYAVYAMVKPVDFLDVEGFKIPQGYYLHRGHAWVKIEDDQSVRVGMDDFASRLLGPFDGVETPLMGGKVAQDGAHIILKRGAQEAKMLCPVSGVVTEINTRVREEGDLVGEDPYAAGWFMRIYAPELRRDLRTLLMGQENRDHLKHEVDRVYRFIEREAGPLAVDGGQLAQNLAKGVPQVPWTRWTRLILRS